MDRRREASQVAGAFLLGAAAGGVAMWLLAPRSGIENRQLLGSSLRSGGERVAKLPKDIAERTNSARRAAGEKVSRLQRR